MAPDDRTRDRIVAYVEANGADSVALFGSYATGEETDDSDIDILVSFEETTSLLELARMQRELSEMVGQTIELVTEGELSPLIRDRVEDEKEVLA